MYMLSMRTTIEIDDHQRAELLKLAAQRGEKGFSSVIRDALNAYLKQHHARRELVKQARALHGTWSETEAAAIEESIQRLRRTWR